VLSAALVAVLFIVWLPTSWPLRRGGEQVDSGTLVPLLPVVLLLVLSFLVFPFFVFFLFVFLLLFRRIGLHHLLIVQSMRFVSTLPWLLPGPCTSSA
jgi:hypothetical protein